MSGLTLKRLETFRRMIGQPFMPAPMPDPDAWCYAPMVPSAANPRIVYGNCECGLCCHQSQLGPQRRVCRACRVVVQWVP